MESGILSPSKRIKITRVLGSDKRLEGTVSWLCDHTNRYPVEIVEEKTYIAMIKWSTVDTHGKEWEEKGYLSHLEYNPVPIETTLYMKGWDETLFAGNKRVCIVKKSDMEKQGLVFGDDITLTIYYFYYDDKEFQMDLRELDFVTLKIVGQIDDSDPLASQKYPNILLPFQTAWDLFEENHVDFTADEVSFYVRDPVALNAFKQEMRGAGFTEIQKGGRPSFKGTALYVQDGIFITMADRLKTAIRILTAFLLPMGILVFVVDYVISHLPANGRVKEFALFRSLGVGAPCAVWSFWCEQLILVFVGNMLGCLVALFVGQQGIQEIVMVCGAAFGGYMLGTTVALLLLAREKPLELLASE